MAIASAVIWGLFTFKDLLEFIHAWINAATALCALDTEYCLGARRLISWVFFRDFTTFMLFKDSDRRWIRNLPSISDKVMHICAHCSDCDRARTPPWHWIWLQSNIGLIYSGLLSCWYKGNRGVVCIRISHSVLYWNLLEIANGCHATSQYELFAVRYEYTEAWSWYWYMIA